ncbi:hypothetical protein HETIRDRAFT_316230 [Heterobasidion irregulare TC 32-1]|uniref:Uncharacterized protein n=1 Tax=Heterobasidion irregulare (strain TC 32-1) TaxID=747525 RepID=W4KAW2_HETIT|nr:uncharacterized protein HETIRDRAFT_316230 [Heterobasidion irregulare TC 32-1]ETW82505.1 hypothetical protein HETIRDRAFT_316230 [Heterobasidion irregulare TC 32-1]
MHINVQLKHRRGTTEAKALIDSGAEGLLIDKQFCLKQGIPLQKIDRFILVFNVDGTANEGVMDKACFLMRITNDEGDYHDEQCKLLATNLGGEDVILEMDWLHKHNPQIDWVKNCLMFSTCAKTCLVSQPRFMIQAQLLSRWRNVKTIRYSRIEDELEDKEGMNETFFSEFYEEWYHQDLFKMHLLEAIRIKSVHSKSQELAEIANKKKNDHTVEEPSKGSGDIEEHTSLHSAPSLVLKSKYKEFCSKT